MKLSIFSQGIDEISYFMYMILDVWSTCASNSIYKIKTHDVTKAPSL